MAKQLQFVYGSVIGKDGSPLVHIQMGEEKGTISPESAAAFAIGVISSAQKATHEARVLAWFREKFGAKVGEEEILALFHEFRQFSPVEKPAPAPAAPTPTETPEAAILRALEEIRGEVSTQKP